MTDMPKAGSIQSLDFSSLLGPLFFVWLLQLPLPVVRAVLSTASSLLSVVRCTFPNVHKFFEFQIMQNTCCMLLPGSPNVVHGARTTFEIKLEFKVTKLLPYSSKYHNSIQGRALKGIYL